MQQLEHNNLAKNIMTKLLTGKLDLARRFTRQCRASHSLEVFAICYHPNAFQQGPLN